MYYPSQKAPEIDFHNYKATCGSVDREIFGKQVLAKLQKMQSKIVLMKAAQEDVSEIEADYTAVKIKTKDLKFLTHLGWLRLKTALEQNFQEISKKYSKSQK